MSSISSTIPSPRSWPSAGRRPRSPAARRTGRRTASRRGRSPRTAAGPSLRASCISARASCASAPNLRDSGNTRCCRRPAPARRPRRPGACSAILCSSPSESKLNRHSPARVRRGDVRRRLDRVAVEHVGRVDADVLQHLQLTERGHLEADAAARPASAGSPATSCTSSRRTGARPAARRVNAAYRSATVSRSVTRYGVGMSMPRARPGAARPASARAGRSGRGHAEGQRSSRGTAVADGQAAATGLGEHRGGLVAGVACRRRASRQPASVGGQRAGEVVALRAVRSPSGAAPGAAPESSMPSATVAMPRLCPSWTIVRTSVGVVGLLRRAARRTSGRS